MAHGTSWSYTINAFRQRERIKEERVDFESSIAPASQNVGGRISMPFASHTHRTPRLAPEECRAIDGWSESHCLRTEYDRY